MLKVRILTAILLGLGLLASLFCLPPAWAVAVFAAVFALAAWEWAGFGGLRSACARIAYTLAVGAALWLCWRWSASAPHLMQLLWLACLWWAAALAWLSCAPGRHSPALALACGVPVLVPAFVAVARLLLAARGFARGPEMVLWMLLLVFAADIGAFFAGRQWGRHKLAPRVSPSKTWEGLAGGIAAVALVALAGALRFGLPVAAAIGFGCAVGAISVVGDLTESMFKRAAGLKDSGDLLPGHGGVLDRIDSVTAAGPLYALGLFESGAVE
jgi:phosphatidate cytidylyltransferase